MMNLNLWSQSQVMINFEKFEDELSILIISSLTVRFILSKGVNSHTLGLVLKI